MDLSTIADISPFLAAFVRAAAFLQAAPFVGDHNLPQRYRVAVAALIALLIGNVRPGLTYDDLPSALVSEIALGLVAGFIPRLIIAGAEAGGQLIGQQLELSFAGIFDTTVAEESLPTRRLARSLAGVAFLSAGGLEAGVRLLATTRASSGQIQHAAAAVFVELPRVMEAALRITAPALVACIVAQITVGLASKAAPALNVFSVSLSLVLVAGAFALIATSPVLAREIAFAGQRAAHVLGGQR